jgi:sec-independent protein translocase protein TatA
MFEGLAQPMHLLILAFIALLFFGPSKLADLGKGLGDGIRHFKDAVKDGGEKPASSIAGETLQK